MNDNEKDFARGECPNCGMPVPILQLLKRRGRAFPCKACGESIKLEFNPVWAGGLAIGAMLLWKSLGVWALPLVAAGLLIMDWKRSKVLRA